MLLRAAGMVDGEIHDDALAPEEPTAAVAELDRVEQVRPLEHVQPPAIPPRRLARLGRLMILEHDAADRVRFGREPAGAIEVGFLLLGLLLLFCIVSVRGIRLSSQAGVAGSTFEWWLG